MSNFPSLQPAMTILVTIDPAIDVGVLKKGPSLNVVPMVGGSAKSEPGFAPAIDAEWVGSGADYIRNDPDGKHMRLDAHGTLKDKSGALFYIHYTGIIAITPELGAVFSASPDAKSTEFGDAFTEIKFETGDERLKALEAATFVSAGRFVYEKGKQVVVEYKVSQVVEGG